MHSSLPAIAVVVLALAGCGGADDAPAGARTAAATRTATAPPPTPTTPATTSTAPQTETDRVGDCLRRLGYRLTGGAPPSHASNAPEYQIVLDSRRGGGYIGFYSSSSRAKRVARQLRVTARRTSGAAVERHGAIDIVWIDLADAAARASVRDCLVT